MATTPQTNTTLAHIADVIRRSDTFAICGHVNPDGDCIGSELALFHTLVACGKHPTVLVPKDEPIDPVLRFLPGSDRLVAAKAAGGTFDVFIALDVPTRERMAEDACAVLDRCRTSITIDHHAVDTTMTDLVYVDPDSASTTMMVWEVAKLLCDEPPYESALCAYTGLVTDTGGFQFQNADVNAFECAADLVRRGVKPSYVTENVFQNRSLASIELESLAVSRMRLVCDGQCALSYVRTSDLVERGAVKEDADPLIDVLRKIRGVRVACILREQGNDVRGGLRSKDDTVVAALARTLGGGGHKAAAGFTLKDTTVDEAVERMTGLLSTMFS